MDSKAVLTIQTKDGEKFSVKTPVASMFGTVKRLIEDGCASGVIPLPAVSAASFRKALKWAAKHSDSPETEKEDELYRDMMAADFLDAAELVDLWAGRVAGEIRGKTHVQIRERFHIDSDFLPGVEEEIIGKNPWAFA